MVFVPIGGEVGVDQPPARMSKAVDDLHVAVIQREVENIKILAQVFFAAGFRDGGDVILLDEPALGVAKGQAAVLYDGDVVMGSSTIAETSRVEQAAANHAE